MRQIPNRLRGTSINCPLQPEALHEVRLVWDNAIICSLADQSCLNHPAPNLDFLTLRHEPPS